MIVAFMEREFGYVSQLAMMKDSYFANIFQLAKMYI